MKRIWLVLIIILSLNLLVGCNDVTQETEKEKSNDVNQGKVVPINNPADYFPLAKGSFWEYEGDGNEYASFNRKVLFTKGNLAQISEDNGGTVITRIIEAADNGIKLVYFEPESYNPNNMLETAFVSNNDTILIKGPIQVGTNWTDNDGAKEIVAVDAQVDTPIGKFDNCIKIKTKSIEEVIYRYYKKDIGMVKQEFISGDTTITSTLKKYKIE